MSLNLDLSDTAKAAYLQTLPSIRERCSRVFELAKQGKLQYFDYHPEKEDDAVAYCIGIMQVLWCPTCALYVDAHRS